MLKLDNSGLSPCQANARLEWASFLESEEKVFILTGPPGTGKSFTTDVLIEDARNILGEIEIHSTATTNKAAAVLSEAIEDEANTVHSLFGLRVRNNFKTGRQDLIRSGDAAIIRNALIVIDEVSMMDEELWAAVDAGSVNCTFLLVGDKDQLAPVMESQPPMFNKGYRTCALKTPMRQKSTSSILQLATQFRNTIHTGKFEPILVNDSDVVKVSGEEFQMLVNQKFTEEMPVNQSKIVAWRNAVVQQYNDYIRSRHYDEENFVYGEKVLTNNPIILGDKTWYATDEMATIVDARADTVKGIDGWWYTLDKGCSVFQAKNQNQVKELLKQLSRSAKQGGSWIDYFQAKEFFVDLRSTHACTTYKSQGSTYDYVFVDLNDIGLCKQWEQVARQLYVAITRARKRVYLYGELPLRYTNMQHKVKAPVVKKPKVDDLPF